MSVAEVVAKEVHETRRRLLEEDTRPRHRAEVLEWESLPKERRELAVRVVEDLMHRNVFFAGYEDALPTLPLSKLLETAGYTKYARQARDLEHGHRTLRVKLEDERLARERVRMGAHAEGVPQWVLARVAEAGGLEALVRRADALRGYENGARVAAAEIIIAVAKIGSNAEGLREPLENFKSGNLEEA